MKLSINTCCVMSICSSRTDSIVYNYGASDTVLLAREKSAKDLGINMTSELTFNTHIHDKINLAYKNAGYY